MGLELVIMGLPQSGKTTVFNALTQATAETGGFSSGDDEPNLANVKVPDDRLQILTDMFKPRRRCSTTTSPVWQKASPSRG